MTWWEERNARFARERAERRERLRAEGYRIVPCVAYYRPSTGEHPRCLWMGETETLVITDVADHDLSYGISCIAVAPGSEVIENPSNAVEIARERNGVVLTVFKGIRPT